MIDMPKHPVLGGHPLHAMTTDVPIGMLPASIVAAIAARRARPRSPVRRISDTLTAMTLASASGVAMLGVWDWLAIPRTHPAFRTAIIHGLLNASGLALLTAAWLRPQRRVALLSAAGAAATAAGWFGGDLVFHQGWRVRPAEEYEIVAERIKEDGQARVVGEAQREIDSFEREKTFLG
jgi:hypothetical protein